MSIRNLNKKDFEIGQKVAIRFQGNRARDEVKGERTYTTGVVEKIGRSLITANGIQFRIETGYNKTQYSPDYQLFESEKVLLEQLEAEKICSKLSSKFSSYTGSGYHKYTIEQLREVAKILNLR